MASASRRGVWFRLALGGITGHKDFARDTGVIVRPEDATSVADAVVRVYIEHGDRTNRNKARLKYVLDAWGFDKFIAAVEEKLGTQARSRARRGGAAASGVRPHRPYRRACAEAGRPQLDRRGAAGRPADRSSRCAALATLAHELGDGDMRLTVWQNLLISGVPDDKVEARRSRHRGARAFHQRHVDPRRPRRLHRQRRLPLRGLRYQAARRRHRRNGARRASPLDTPVNIHLTGCHHSCAQHYIGDIGLLACKVEASEDGDQVEGYHVHVGGGFGPDAVLAREIFRDVPAPEAPKTIERMLKAYLANRAAPDETFLAFSRRHEVEQLKAMVEAEGAE